MRIGIDARFLTHPQRGGFKTYSENLIAALGEEDSENEYYLYLDRPPDEQTRLPNRPNFKSRLVPGLLPILGMPWREQVSLVRQASRDRLDLLHSPSLTAPLGLRVPLVVTIHDMIWFLPNKFSNHHPQLAQRKPMEWYYRLVPQLAVRRASAVITVSQAAQKSILEYLPCKPDRVFVTYEAASRLYRQIESVQEIKAICQKYALNREFILAIGSADPRKNIKTLVEAFSLLPADLRTRYNLVIIWTHDLLETEISHQVERLGLNSQVQFLRDVPNEDLVVLYNAATLFVFPSRYEGFGLPPLEAMACGTPVAASDNSSIPEIVGDAALLFEAEDTQGMAGVIADALSDDALRASLTQKGLARAACFSWQKCARQTIAAYRQALGLSELKGDLIDLYSP